ncbi:MAG: polyprenyl synthetase family protein [Andreesenia angusta]|nr:polyprenyl synthetase family protein [Andreesenia angusta]
MKNTKEIFELALNAKFKTKECPQKKIYESIGYSLFAGGKRIRPILCMKMYEIFQNDDYDDVIDFAISLEMIHTYSLIHDDLPAMDNDDYRRGKLTNHKVFKEDIAILAGDGLLNLAYENMFEKILSSSEKNRDRYIRAAKIISDSAGIDGMIGGQVVDMLSERNDESRIELNKEILEYIHINKTSKLIEASLLSGAVIGGAIDEEIDIVREYGRIIGQLFQIRDDILDEIGDSEKLGKSVGIDKRNNKLTYISLYGLDKTIEIAEKLALDAKKCLQSLDRDISFFENMVDYLMTREK